MKTNPPTIVFTQVEPTYGIGSTFIITLDQPNSPELKVDQFVEDGSAQSCYCLCKILQKAGIIKIKFNPPESEEGLKD